MAIRTALTAAALAAALSSGAFAQFEVHERSRLGIAMTVGRPSDSKLRDVKGLWPGPTAYIHFAWDEHDRPTLMASAGWFAGESDTGKANMLPMSVTYLKHFGRSEESSFYVGGAVDVYITYYKFYGYDPNLGDFAWMSQGGKKLGVGALAGYQFGGGWFAELRYDKVGKLSLADGGKADFSGLWLSVGSRLAF